MRADKCNKADDHDDPIVAGVRVTRRQEATRNKNLVTCDSRDSEEVVTEFPIISYFHCVTVTRPPDSSFSHDMLIWGTALLKGLFVTAQVELI